MFEPRDNRVGRAFFWFFVGLVLALALHECGARADSCEEPPPACEYGRKAVCYEGKWYCAADHEQFDDEDDPIGCDPDFPCPIPEVAR